MSREWKVGATRVKVMEGDLTEQQVDAIVNAANNELQHGGGVAGAISRRGGPGIQAESDRHGPVAVGEAAITGGGSLPARYGIHAASMRLGGRTTAESLRSSMDHVFRLARERGLRTIAVPAVGTGIARFPMRDCAEIMADSVAGAAAADGAPEEVRFVLYGGSAAAEFEDAFAAALARQRRTGQ
jgi:O-acetyl-ADP-ribose deacetylase